MKIPVNIFTKKILRNYVNNRPLKARCLASFRENADDKGQNPESGSNKWLFGAAALSGILGYGIYRYKNREPECIPLPLTPQEVPGKKKELPMYTMEEVQKHMLPEDRVWVTYKDGVYDITDFIEEHPGGPMIMMAAGGPVEPFWNVYGVHYNPHVLELMDEFKIGKLKEGEKEIDRTSSPDPFSDEPKRSPLLKYASLKPFNAECPAIFLAENFITPNELFFVRNHLPVPNIDPKTYELEVEIEGSKKTLNLTLEELKKFPKHTITATIMCAGNRRSEMTQVKPVKGLRWGSAAVGNAQWSGAKLRDVLQSIGITENDEDTYNHIQFEGGDVDLTGAPYGASIPFWRGVDRKGDVLLAYEMNGSPIPRDHGFPVRAVVPGIVGARNVKWLAKIVVSKEESNSHWQKKDYKGFSPSTDWDTLDYSKSPAIQELPVISAICRPQSGDVVKVEDGHITVKGYAWSGGGQRIIRVDLTTDAGNTWYVANLEAQSSSKPPKHWSWTIWSAKLPIPEGTKEVEIWAKAVDSCYNTQPESFKNIWNVRGVLSNAYHRVKINLVW